MVDRGAAAAAGAAGGGAVGGGGGEALAIFGCDDFWKKFHRLDLGLAKAAGAEDDNAGAGSGKSTACIRDEATDARLPAGLGAGRMRWPGMLMGAGIGVTVLPVPWARRPATVSRPGSWLGLSAGLPPLAKTAREPPSTALSCLPWLWLAVAVAAVAVVAVVLLVMVAWSCCCLLLGRDSMTAGELPDRTISAGWCLLWFSTTSPPTITTGFSLSTK